MQVREFWRPKQMSASGTLVTAGGSTAGFLCTTAGNVVITAGEASGGATIVASIAALAGTWYPLPFRYDTGAYATLSGGAVVTFGVG